MSCDRKCEGCDCGPVPLPDAPADVEAVLDLSQTRIWRCRARLGICEDVIAWDNPLAVLDGTGKRIGFAAVQETGMGQVVADLGFDYGTPERLEMETGTQYWAHQVLVAIPGDPDCRADLVALRLRTYPVDVENWNIGHLETP